MLNWGDYELRAIIGHWWNAEIVFADENGNVKNISRENMPTFSSKLFNMLMKSPRGLDLLTEACRAVAKEAKSDKKFYQTWNDTGLSCFIVPIFLENSFAGIVFATAFFTEKTSEKDKEKLYKVLRDLGYTSKEIESSIANTKTILKDQLVYFDELVELVGSEIETLNEEITSREDKISQLNKELGTRYRYENMIGKSSIMQDLYNLLDKIKHSTSTVLIQGDNGTGKELIAKAIHYNSPRKDKIFVVQNCSAFNDNLLESELFGHTKGSFTGAVKDKKGLFEIAVHAGKDIKGVTGRDFHPCRLH
jgi:two-component system response regulator HupR/HoxA